MSYPHSHNSPPNPYQDPNNPFGGQEYGYTEPNFGSNPSPNPTASDSERPPLHLGEDADPETGYDPEKKKDQNEYNPFTPKPPKSPLAIERVNPDEIEIGDEHGGEYDDGGEDTGWKPKLKDTNMNFGNPDLAVDPENAEHNIWAANVPKIRPYQKPEGRFTRTAKRLGKPLTETVEDASIAFTGLDRSGEREVSKFSRILAVARGAGRIALVAVAGELISKVSDMVSKGLNEWGDRLGFDAPETHVSPLVLPAAIAVGGLVTLFNRYRKNGKATGAKLSEFNWDRFRRLDSSGAQLEARNRRYERRGEDYDEDSAGLVKRIRQGIREFVDEHGGTKAVLKKAGKAVYKGAKQKMADRAQQKRDRQAYGDDIPEPPKPPSYF